MRIPLEYGDNFPVPTGSWNPAEPWRFPKHEILPPERGVMGYVQPWITLGLGLSMGVLWMSWRTELVKPRPAPGLTGAVPRQEEGLRVPDRNPGSHPVRMQVRSGLA